MKKVILILVLATICQSCRGRIPKIPKFKSPGTILQENEAVWLLKKGYDAYDVYNTTSDAFKYFNEKRKNSRQIRKVHYRKLGYTDSYIEFLFDRDGL